MKTALILIDIQNDYFPGGRMELEGPVEAAAHVHAAFLAALKSYGQVIPSTEIFNQLQS